MESDYRVPLQNAGHRSQVSFLRYKFRISILALGVLFNLLFAINSTFGCTTINEIRGPMLLSPTCSTTPVTYQYYMQPVVSNGIQNPWSIFPANCGSILNQTANSVSVKWNFAGSLIYNWLTIQDTLYMQECCADPFPGISIKVFDVDDRFYSINDLATILGGNVNTATQTIEVVGKQLFIQGMLNLNHTNVKFSDCDLWMGKGAAIYSRLGWYQVGPLTYPGFEMENGTVQGVCGMWKGIIIGGDSYVKLTNIPTFTDAEYALRLNRCKTILQMDNCIFSKNFAGLKTGPEPSQKTCFAIILNPPYNYDSYFQNCTFDGTDPITLPTFNGQVGIPQGQRAFAGMIINDLIAPQDRSTAIPFSTTPGTSCTFTKLNFGIYAIHSQVDVYNCNFNIIKPYQAYPLKINGIAVYSVMLKNFINVLNVGDDDSPTASNRNYFTDVNYGIYTMGRISSTIKYNLFLHRPLDVSDPVQSGISIALFNAYYRNLIIENNSFTEQAITSGVGFASTGIYISNNLPSINPTTISGNIFHDVRISIYAINTGGTNSTFQDFNIFDNYIYSNLSHTEINAASYNHYGIWLNAIRYGWVYNNTISRSVPIGQASSNFVNLMLGMNIKSAQIVEIRENEITNYGTGMRFVSNCNASNLLCNKLNACVQGVNLSLASMTAQGSLNNPWDNEWNQFPTLNATTYNRVDGTVLALFDWYNRGQANTTGYYNAYSPEPVNHFIVYPIDGALGPQCTPTPSSTIISGKMEEIVGDSIVYINFPEESLYLDKEFAYKILKNDPDLRSLNPEFEDFYLALQQENMGKFSEAEQDEQNGNFSAAFLKLDLITDPTIIESNRKYTYQVALQKEIEDNRELVQDEIDGLTPIANINAWEGGPAVYIARATLMTEVDDRENNLRVRQTHTTPKAPANFAIYPNPTSDNLTVFFNKNDGENITAKITDLYGRIILQQNLQNNSIDLSNFRIGSYLISFYEGNSFLSNTRFSVVK